MKASALWEAIRPWQWVKNLFVFAPAVFGLRIHQLPTLLHVTLTFVSFCLAASASYLLNDVVDRARDLQNPRTRQRPVARGDLSPVVALGAAGAFALCAVSMSWKLGVLFPVVAYLAVSTLYSLFFKKLPVVDVASLASLYVLRLVAGSQAAALPPSFWLLSCGGLLALSLATGKRLEGNRRFYTRPGLQITLDVFLVLTAATYLAYTLSGGLGHHLPRWFLLSVVPAWAGLWRYRTLALRGVPDPSEALYGDKGMRLTTAAWMILALALAAAGLK